MIGKLSSNLPAETRMLAAMQRQVEESRRHCGNGPLRRSSVLAGQYARSSRSTEAAPEGGEFLPPQPDDRRSIEPAQLAKRFGYCLAGGADRCRRVAVRAAGRLRYDGIDDPEPNQVLRGDFHAR